MNASNRPKTILVMCLGVLALSAAFQLQTDIAFGQVLDPKFTALEVSGNWNAWATLTVNGDFYTKMGPFWEYQENILDQATSPVPNPEFVALQASATWGNFAALTKNGDFYIRGQSWEYRGNVLDQGTSQILDPEFVALLVSDNFAAFASLTKNGDFYTRMGQYWEFQGNIMATATSTPPALDTQLDQNYPNPFNPSTAISFELTVAQPVKVTVYTIAGELVATLVNESLPAGAHEITWDGRDSQGRQVASGTYVYRLEAGSFIETKRMLLVR